MKRSFRTRVRWQHILVAAGTLGVALLALALWTSRGQAADSCGLPSSTPVWIDYGEGSVKPDVRDVLARPGVVVASSGTAVPRYYRAHGAATMYFVLHFSLLVGEPSDPSDSASILDAADKLYAKAVESSGCATPWIALNELFGTNLATPWSRTNATYRANVLAFMQRLHDRGARPALLLQGNPNTDGDAAQWWRQVARAGAIVYESYYDAKRISSLGTVIGTRRMRLGERAIIHQLERAGVTPDRLGIMLGFHSAQTPGIGGRQGLQPTEAWLRVVKWEALEAAQVAKDEQLGSVWSWGWGTFGPESVDADKAAAACVYLWARDQSLCDGPAAAGAAFSSSLAEGQILLPPGVTCTFAGGHVPTAAVDALARLTHSRRLALTGVFARVALRSAASVPLADVLAAEQAAVDRVFHGSRRAYLEALTRSRATLGVARNVVRDELRRRVIAEMLVGRGSPQSTLEWTADREARAVDTAVCLDDDLPGGGGFPQTNAREIGVVPLLAKLPYLFSDRAAPMAPPAPTITPGGVGILVLRWSYGGEGDLAGYRVYRSAISGGPYEPVGPFLDRSILVDTTAPRDATSYYVVRAVDTSGNVSTPSPELAATPPSP